MPESDFLELTLYHAATEYAPSTSLVYRARRGNVRVAEALARVDERERPIGADASVLELAFRYRHKNVSKAVICTENTVYEDTNGDGLMEFCDGEPAPVGMSAWVLVNRMFEGSPETASVSQAELLYETVSSLTGEEALAHAFRATCGSTAAVVHQLRGHSVLWASIPPGARPNAVHRHLGGNVYCLFFRGVGRFHRIDQQRGFETLPVCVTESNPFQMIAIPTHLWYQPANTGDIALQYFMIHEPAFDQSELIELERRDCRPEWNFEF
jgi:hypothetical protein